MYRIITLFQNLLRAVRGKGARALLLALAMLAVGGCTTTRGPLIIRDVSVKPEPLIGQTATLHVEFISRRDEPEATIGIGLTPGVKLMEGELLWEGPLKANQPQSHEIEICVLYEGHWLVWLTANSDGAKDTGPGNVDGEILHITTTADSAQVARSKDYRPPERMPSATDVPKTPPADICP